MVRSYARKLHVRYGETSAKRDQVYSWPLVHLPSPSFKWRTDSAHDIGQISQFSLRVLRNVENWIIATKKIPAGLWIVSKGVYAWPLIHLPPHSDQLHYEDSTRLNSLSNFLFVTVLPPQSPKNSIACSWDRKGAYWILSWFEVVNGAELSFCRIKNHSCGLSFSR